MRFYVILFLVFLSPVSGLCEVYKWVDEKGKLHFSDKKPEENLNAESVNVDVNVVESQVKFEYEAPPPREAKVREPFTAPLSERKKKKLQEQAQCAAQWEEFRKSESCWSSCGRWEYQGGPGQGYRVKNTDGCSAFCTNLKRPMCRLED